jgi:hypothetical protein
MTRYDNLMDLNAVERTTKMMRVVDRQGYHLCWIDVSGLDKFTAVMKALRLGHAEEDKKPARRERAG